MSRQAPISIRETLPLADGTEAHKNGRQNRGSALPPTTHILEARGRGGPGQHTLGSHRGRNPLGLNPSHKKSMNQP